MYISFPKILDKVEWIDAGFKLFILVRSTLLWNGITPVYFLNFQRRVLSEKSPSDLLLSNAMTGGNNLEFFVN